MEGMWDEMVRLGIEEHNTSFLVSGVETIPGMAALQDEDLYAMGMESAMERRRVLDALSGIAVQGERPRGPEPPTAQLEAAPAGVSDAMLGELERKLQKEQAAVGWLKGQLETRDKEVAGLAVALEQQRTIATGSGDELARCKQQLEREQEHGRESLRSELHQFMLQVSVLTDQNHQLATQLHQAQERSAHLEEQLAATERMRSEQAEIAIQLEQRHMQALQGLQDSLLDRTANLHLHQGAAASPVVALTEVEAMIAFEFAPILQNRPPKSPEQSGQTPDPGTVVDRLYSALEVLNPFGIDQR
eukprot:TRINITY_DN19601_c0_g1_i2.p1 TRINITY_DN19601_c0_g1~~TRINITY_DN19601_c0_g1_i2.p1  ORF type:complete len:303 (+),score=97.08 TRINITY_DN19601_c0_g1_i2:250-1158(+)